MAREESEEGGCLQSEIRIHEGVDAGGQKKTNRLEPISFVVIIVTFIKFYRPG